MGGGKGRDIPTQKMPVIYDTGDGQRYWPVLVEHAVTVGLRIIEPYK